MLKDPPSITAIDTALSGFQLLKSLPEMVRGQHPHVPVLLMTGYDSNMNATGHLADGMALLSKPFSMDALNEHARKLIQWSHAQREA